MGLFSGLEDRVRSGAALKPQQGTSIKDWRWGGTTGEKWEAGKKKLFGGDGSSPWSGGGLQSKISEVTASNPRAGMPSPYEGLSDISGMRSYDIQDPRWTPQQIDTSTGLGYSVGPYASAQLGDLREMERMNFDPYRRRALQDVDATSASGRTTAESQLARSGGLSAADRMAMASQFNRNRIAGRQGALGKYDELESGNIYDVGRANVDIYNQGQLQQFGADQDAAMRMAEAETAASRYASGQRFDAAARNQAAVNQARQRQAMAAFENQQAKFGADIDRYKFGKQMEGAEKLASQQWEEAGRRSEIEKAGNFFSYMQPGRKDSFWNDPKTSGTGAAAFGPIGMIPAAIGYGSKRM